MTKEETIHRHPFAAKIEITPDPSNQHGVVGQGWLLGMPSHFKRPQVIPLSGGYTQNRLVNFGWLLKSYSELVFDSR